jgi:hypothetical protein
MRSPVPTYRIAAQPNASKLGAMTSPTARACFRGDRGLAWFQGWSSGRPASAEPADLPDRRQRRRPLTRTSHPYGGVRGACGGRTKSSTARRRSSASAGTSTSCSAGAAAASTWPVEIDPRDYRLPDRTPIDPSLYVGALPTELVAPPARLRTDLDRFLAEEAGCLLSYHAYWSTHARLAALDRELAVRAPSWLEYADLAPAEIGHLRRLLVHGARRVRLPARG